MRSGATAATASSAVGSRLLKGVDVALVFGSRAVDGVLEVAHPETPDRAGGSLAQSDVVPGELSTAPLLGSETEVGPVGPLAASAEEDGDEVIRFGRSR